MKKPRFKNDEEAARFWESHEPMDYISETRRVQTPRPPRSQAISLRLDPTMLGLTKRIARRKGIGYQTLLKIWITEAVSREIDRSLTGPLERILGDWITPVFEVASRDTTHTPLETPRYLSPPKIAELSSAEQESPR